MSWTDERVETLKRMWSEGQSASQIAKELGGVTRNAVIGKVHRLGLSNRVGAAPVPETKPKAAAAPAAPSRSEAPAAEAPTTRFAAAKPARDDRDIGSWLGELRDKKSGSQQPPQRPPDPVHPADTDRDEATTVFPAGGKTTEIPAADPLSAEETRAIPISRPGDPEAATEQINARGKQSGGVSAQDLLRREGRL